MRSRSAAAFPSSSSRGLAALGDNFLQLGIDADASDGSSFLVQFSNLSPRGWVNGQVVVKLGFLDEAGPGLLLRIETLLDGALRCQNGPGGSKR